MLFSFIQSGIINNKNDILQKKKKSYIKTQMKDELKSRF